MHTLDLALLTHNEVSMLTGHERGVQAREFYKLDELDMSNDTLTISAPADLDTITPSFVQGFLAKSVHTLGRDRIYQKYDLGSLPGTLKEDFQIGVKRLLLRQSAAGSMNSR